MHFAVLLIHCALSLSPQADPVRAPHDPEAALGRRAAVVGQVLRGHVTWPAGSPQDPSLAVVALGGELAESLPNGRWARPGERSWDRREVLGRAPVSPAGHFELSLAEGAALAGLDLDGCQLFLHEPLLLEPDAPIDAPIVLEPELGGALRGVVELPPGDVVGDDVAVRIGASGSGFAGAGMTRTATLVTTSAGGRALEFELRGLQAGLEYTVWACSERHPGLQLDELVRVGPGERASVRIPLQAGATVRGTVRDEGGRPVPGARVRGDVGSGYWPLPEAGVTSADERGAFELRGLAPRPQALTVDAADFLRGASDELGLADGVTLEQVEVRLERGLALAGRCELADGRPAAGARLTVAPLDPGGVPWELLERLSDPEGVTQADADGRFRVGALPPGAYALYVWEERSGERLRAASIEAGDEELRLVLASAVTLEGRAVDERGDPLERFTVAARRADWPAYADGPALEREQAFEGAGGRFALALEPGEWALRLRAEGHLPSEDRTVLVPPVGTHSVASRTEATEPFVLKRTARLAGVVLDPHGAPVRGAEVRARSQSIEGRDDATETDASGRFELPSVGPGPVRLLAESSHWADSDELRFELAPGDRQADLSVTLGLGGTVSGLVLDAQGAPDAGQPVVLQSERGNVHEQLAEANGRFRFEHLTPGTYQVMAPPDESAWDQPDLDLGEVFAELRMKVVQVELGGEAEIVLGAPARAPVVIHGRVLRGGQPIPSAALLVVREAGSLVEGTRADTADDEGRYEVRVDEPGDYTFALMPSEHLDSPVDFHVTVPEVSHFEFDLELPDGTLAGRVVGSDGRPAEGALLWVRREDAASELAALADRGPLFLDEDGRFRVEALHAGSYTLSAVGGADALTTFHGVRAGAAAGVELELELAPAGRLSGIVRDASGAPAEGANVLLRDRDGRPLPQLTTSTDHTGAFELGQVPAGELQISARAEGLVAADTVVRVSAGETPLEVALTLAPGGTLRVRCEDAEGFPVRATLRVEDFAGRDHAALLTQAELQELFTRGLAPGEREVGPLPPGTYEVLATCIDGREARERVELGIAAQDARLVLRSTP